MQELCKIMQRRHCPDNPVGYVNFMEMMYRVKVEAAKGKLDLLFEGDYMVTA